MSKSRFFSFIIVGFLSSSFAVAQASSRALDKNQQLCQNLHESSERTLPPSSNSVKLNKAPDLIFIEKSQRRLTVFNKDQALKQYHVSLGYMPMGAKTAEGDGRTPEGAYTIEYKNPNSQFHLSLKISYPNALDIERARIFGVDPGGDIMIHGFPEEDFYLKVATFLHNKMANWTQGCVAVTNAEIEELYALVKVGTRVQICP